MKRLIMALIAITLVFGVTPVFAGQPDGLGVEWFFGHAKIVDEKCVYFGTDDNTYCCYDEITDDRVECAGDDMYFANNMIFAGTTTISGTTSIDSPVFTTLVDISDFATVSELLVTDASGYIVTLTGVSSTEAGYLNGVTSAIQTQMDTKAPIDNPVFTTEIDISDFGTASELLVTDASSNIVTLTGVSSTEAGYLDGVTSAIQTQLNLLAPLDSPAFTTLTSHVDDVKSYWGTGNDLMIEMDNDGVGCPTITSIGDLDIVAATELNIEANGNAGMVRYAPIGYLSATEFQTAAPFSAFTSTGIEGGGQGVIGSADAYLGIGDAADELNLGFTIPETSLVGDAGYVLIEFDFSEQAAEECNVDVVIYEYGNNVPIVTDTLTVANGAARAWVTLDVLATGIGALVSAGQFYVMEITAVADTDDFNLYGVRVTYDVGFDNNG